MGDSGRHFAKRYKVFLQLDLILQFDDLREIGQQADCAFDVTFGVGNGREIDADTLVVVGSHLNVELDTSKNLSGVQAFVQEIPQILRFAYQIRQHRVQPQSAAEDAFTGRIECGDRTI